VNRKFTEQLAGAPLMLDGTLADPDPTKPVAALLVALGSASGTSHVSIDYPALSEQV
jgi:hypothetical protein